MDFVEIMQRLASEADRNALEGMARFGIPTDDGFESLLPLIVREAEDERKYVRKAVSWALRQIGSGTERSTGPRSAPRRRSPGSIHRRRARSRTTRSAGFGATRSGRD